MRPTRRRLLGLGIIVVTSILGVLAAPAPAHAGTCDTGTVGSDGVTVCPFQ
jgi:hypothetical protein